MGAVTATEEELRERYREEKRVARMRRKERALLGKNSKDRKPLKSVEEYHVAKRAVEDAHKEITCDRDLAKPENKQVPFVVGHKGVGRPPKKVGITDRLKEVLGVKASFVEDAREYADLAGLDADKTTVRDCVVHNMITMTLKGSAPHLKELMERVDGKVVQKVEAMVNGQMSITEAVSMLDLTSNDYSVEEE